jgi:hypothetical protein
MRKLVSGFSFLLVVVLGTCAVWAQEPTNHPYRARVFITDSKSWEMSGGGGGSRDGFGTASGGGARPQTAEIIKTFSKRCPEAVVNNKQDRADYVVLLDHEGGKATFLRDNKVAVFNRDGDSIVSHSTRSLGNAVKDACTAIMADWKEHGAAIRAARAQGRDDGKARLAPAAATSMPKLSVTSNPLAADIEVDGAFVGNTPSTVDLAPGDHTLALVKSGYKRWERKVKVTGGNVNINAELEPEGR